MGLMRSSGALLDLQGCSRWQEFRIRLQRWPDRVSALPRRFFTRECLRSWSQVQAEGSNVADSHKWILAYAKQYFEDGGRAAILSRRRDLEPAQPAATAFPTAEELEAKIRAIFLEADKDGNGILDRKEFKRVMKLFAQELNLKASMASAFDDHILDADSSRVH